MYRKRNKIEGYDKIKEDLGFHGCLWWTLFSLWQLFRSRFSLLGTWQFWVYLLGGMFIGALLMIPWYFVIRGISKLLLRTWKIKFAYYIRWLLYIIDTVYIILLANLAFNQFFVLFPAEK